MIDLRYGLVVATHPEDHSVDLVMTDDYSRVAGVQVMCDGGLDFGRANLFSPDDKSGDDKWSMAKRTADDVKAIVLWGARMPVVIGFLYPQVGQMTFSDKNRFIDRHSSDVYETIDAAGNWERAFPNGGFIRYATTPDHEDLTGKDVDKNWAIKKNTSAATHLRVVLGNAGAVKFDFHTDPDGNVAVTAQGACTLNITGDSTINTHNATLNAAVATVNASTKIELATPLVHCTQNLVVDGTALVKGSITGQAGMAISGGTGGATAMITGNMAVTSGSMTVTGGNVTADGIGLKTHHHTEHDGPSTSAAVA